MKTTIRILAVIALMQIALILTTWMNGPKLQSHTLGSQLLTFDRAALDSILIKDNEHELLLEKKNGKWLLADGFPADQKKVAALLDKLSSLQYSLPMATSAQALSRFKVAEDNYNRKLQLQSNNKTLAELFLGTGAGARQSHVRNGEQNSVYTVTIGNYDLPATQDSWQDKKILTFDKENVTAIELGDLKLHCKAETGKKGICSLWQGRGLSADTDVNQQVVNEVLEKLASLRFTQVLGRENLPEYGLSQPLLTMKLFLKNGDRVYNFGKLRDSEDICLKVSDRNEYFQLASYSAKPLLEQIKKDTFVTTKAVSSKEETTEAEK